MTEQELKCYEKLANDLYKKGKQFISEGNPCTDIVSVLFAIEELVLKELETTTITALVDELDLQDQACRNHLYELGDHNYGY